MRVNRISHADVSTYAWPSLVQIHVKVQEGLQQKVSQYDIYSVFQQYWWVGWQWWCWPSMRHFVWDLQMLLVCDWHNYEDDISDRCIGEEISLLLFMKWWWNWSVWKISLDQVYRGGEWHQEEPVLVQVHVQVQVQVQVQEIYKCV